MDPDKDVDGMHPVNMGRLALMMPGPVPATPAGIEALLAFYEIPVAGHEVCILGRGTTLGRPLALLLSQKRSTANAAVTVVHTGVPDWPEYTRRAGIVVAAAGVPGILQPEHISPGAVVVGGGVRYEGRRLLPDVDEACEEVAGAITPRVGGVGPTTIAMLFRNAVEAAERSRSMTMPEPPAPSSRAYVCPLCGAAVGSDDERCPACNMTLAGVGAAPGALQPALVVALGGGAPGHLRRGPGDRRRSSAEVASQAMSSKRHTIIYTHTDEAPALATRSLLPVVNAFTDVAGVQVELRDISLSGRVLAVVPRGADARAAGERRPRRAR